MAEDPKNQEMSPWKAYALVGEIGYLIAIPAFLFGFGGAYLDKYLHTSPLFLILGLVIALVSSMMAVRRTVRRMIDADATVKVPKKQETNKDQFSEQNDQNT